jgi:hypothetical protein
MVMTRDELVDKIVDLFIDNSDNEGGWDACAITEAVMSLLVSEARDRLGQCETCSTWFPIHLYDDCPYWDDHMCSGGCGEANHNCTCDCCKVCGYYDCQCPTCTKCGLIEGECQCPAEEAVFA